MGAQKISERAHAHLKASGTRRLVAIIRWTVCPRAPGLGAPDIVGVGDRRPQSTTEDAGAVGANPSRSGLGVERQRDGREVSAGFHQHQRPLIDQDHRLGLARHAHRQRFSSNGGLRGLHLGGVAVDPFQAR
jgi:hypothetical protein